MATSLVLFCAVGIAVRALSFAAMAHASDEKAKDDMQTAESGAKHQYLQFVGQQQRQQPEQNEEDTQSRNDPRRGGARGDQRTAIEKQPSAGDGMQVARKPMYGGHHQTGAQRG